MKQKIVKVLFGCIVSSVFGSVTDAENTEADDYIVGRGYGHLTFRLEKDGSICELNKTNKCKTSDSDKGFSIKTSSRFWERGFLLRFCLEVEDTKARESLTDDDFDRNFRANIIAIPANMYSWDSTYWSNVFIEDFSKEDITEEGK